MTNGNDDYKVGYRRPPLDTRFEKGKSGNPKGRRTKPGRPTVSLREILEEPQAVQVAGRRVNMSKGEILVRKQIEKAMQGDHRTAKMLMEFMAKNSMIDRTAAPAFDVEGVKEQLARKLDIVLRDSAPGPSGRNT